MTSSWMIVAGFLFATMAVFVKLGSAHFDATELAFYRSLVTFVFVLGMVAINKGTVKSPYMGTHVIRGVAGGLNVWILAGMGLCGTLAQLAMTRAYRTGNTLVVGSLSYSTLVFGAVATFIVWDERLAPLEWAGMAVIVASGIMAMRVEKKEQVEEAGFES